MTDTWAAKVLVDVRRYRVVVRNGTLSLPYGNWPDHELTPVITEADALAALAKLGAGDVLVERAEAALEGVTGGPWLYRPDKHDDWGVVKADDFHLCQVRNPNCYTPEQLNEARAAKIDPWEANGRFTAFTREWVPEALAHIAALNARIATMIDADAVQAMLDAAQPIMAEACRGYEEQIAALTAERDRQYDENVHRIAEQAKAEAERDDLRALVAELVAEIQPLRTKTLQDAVAMERAARIIANGQPDKISDAAAILRAALTDGGKDG